MMRTKAFFYSAVITILFVSGFTADRQLPPRLGIGAGLSQDSLAHAAGFTMIGESVRKMLAPDLTEAAFQQNLKKIKGAKCKLMMCNLFFPGSLKIAGPDVIEPKVLGYADSVLLRAEQAGVKFIVLGSGGSRNIPEGYPLDKTEAAFVPLGRKLGELAKKHNVVIALENLETTETNFITSLKSAAAVVRKVNHPNFRLNADIFHMMREGEAPSEIIAAGDLLAFCELAEKEKRSLPGVMNDDFKPYFRALRKVNYKGFIFIEGTITNAAVEIPNAFKYLTNQLAEVYAEK
ncbi:sugar phosphate isomerase/epimerase family protein [Pedobacter aquatilis]|uniref:sugar phosphate isomerase/epimerase family protein n=1 Tax=Pedobacter aquatilis TaxID=351343 RepID=UPI00292F1801|nr:sugar phosphate isomerase/epimerase family protein [Pedobacter aquatilis]